jgi:cobalamin biosynthesis Mg chelatase CobN
MKGRAGRTPTIPLTLRGMRRHRHRPRTSARFSFLLPSALALLAFACVPALAQAECTDSSCAQYEVEIPTGNGEHKPQHHKPGNEEEEAPAKISHAPGAKHGGPESSHPNSEEAEENRGGGAGNGGGNNGGGGNKPSSPGGGSQGNEGLGGEQEVSPSTTQGQNASPSSGGSSPLVPILIAIAVLAAISIGAVIYRQRRGGSGSPVSPKAG